jgi:multiple sugar transport system substrate-binding protein
MRSRGAVVLAGLLLGLAFSLWGWARSVVIPVSILMPAPFAEATAELVHEFNRSHPGIHLRVTRGPLETESVSDLAISGLLMGDSPYDLLLMDVTWTAKYAAAGWLEPLEPWLGPDALVDLAPGAEQGNTFGGHLWRFPLVADMGLLYWRTDLMETPPRTPEQLVQISRDLQIRGAVPWGYVWQGRQYEGLSCVYVEMLSAFGGRWLMGDQPELDSTAALAATDWLRNLVTQGITPPTVANMAEPEALQAFQAGDAAFMRNWPYAWAELNKPEGPLRGRVGITTMVSEPGQPHAATQGSWGLALLQQSQHKAAAIEALRYLTSEGAQIDLNLRWGYTPTRLSVFNNPMLLEENPVLAELQEALAASVLRPITPVYAQLSDLLYRSLNTVITDASDAGTAMTQLQTNSTRLLVSTGGLG